MTIEEIQALKILIVSTNEYYNKALNDRVVEMQVSDLIDLEFNHIVTALKAYRRDPKNKFAPLPSQIRALIQEPVDNHTLALNTVSRIIECLSKIGPYNQTAVQEYVGPIGWRIIENEGGWNSLCESVNYENIGIYRAQWKQLAEVFHAKEIRQTITGITDQSKTLLAKL